MSLLKIKDNNPTKKEDFHDISNLVKRISDKTLKQLEKDGVFVFPRMITEIEDLTSDQMILQSVDDSYVTGNVMGYLGCGDDRLIITSRFIKGDDDFFLQYLLERVLKFPSSIILESNAQKENRMLNLLIFLFPEYLKAALRKGPYKTYIRTEYNDENVKGTIDIQRQIKKNTPFTGKIAYNQREQTLDNYMMELIRHTVEYIKGKPYGYKLLESVKDEVQEVNDITFNYSLKERKRIIEDNKKNTIRHAYYSEYRALQRLCILILQNEKQQIGLGNRKVYGILFDGAWLWEEYINQLVKDIFVHPMNKLGSKAQWLFTTDEHFEGKIFPDFISKDKEKRVIADAKYKPAKNIGHGNNDYYQVLAYMYRFDSKLGYYFYPETENTLPQILWLNQGLSHEEEIKARTDICLKKHGLVIPPNAASFEDFKQKIEIEEERFVDEMGVSCMSQR